ncbi:hypothetical protein LTR95_002349 [Oleoguttula sp. CCFEE 5521]
MANGQQVALVVGASRGIGRQVAIDLAKSGYTVVVAAKTTSDASQCHPFPPDPNSQQSTINTVAREITEAGGEALALPVDVRSFDDVSNMVSKIIEKFSRLDVLIYNSGAIWWSSVKDTPMKRFQLMQRVDPKGCRVVIVSPPVYSRFFRGKTAYAVGKVGMSVLTMGLAMDWEREGRDEMAITSIWPAAAVESAATQNSKADRAQLRKPTILSDAILAILKAQAKDVNGQCLLDEDFLRTHEGVTDLAKYACVPGADPRRIMPAEFPDLRVAEQVDEGTRMDSTQLRKGRL